MASRPTKAELSTALAEARALISQRDADVERLRAELERLRTRASPAATNFERRREAARALCSVTGARSVTRAEVDEYLAALG